MLKELLTSAAATTFKNVTAAAGFKPARQKLRRSFKSTLPDSVIYNQTCLAGFSSRVMMLT